MHLKKIRIEFTRQPFAAPRLCVVKYTIGEHLWKIQIGTQRRNGAEKYTKFPPTEGWHAKFYQGR
jgi:hypothetical protein